MSKLLSIFLIVSNIFIQAQVKYNRVQFIKGIPENISFKWDKAEYDRININGFYKDLYIICRDTNSFDNSIYFLLRDVDNSIILSRITLTNGNSNEYNSHISLRTKSEDELSNLNIRINNENNFVEYVWGDSVNGYSQNPQIVKVYSLKPGKRFPSISLQSKSRTYNLDEIKNKIIVLNWWATNCIPCIEEIPGLNKLVKKYDKSDVIFLAIVWDKENLDEFLKKYPFKYFQTYGNDEVFNFFGGVFPRNIIIGKDHKIIFNNTGALSTNWKQLDAILENIL